MRTVPPFNQQRFDLLQHAWNTSSATKTTMRSKTPFPLLPQKRRPLQSRNFVVNADSATKQG